MSGKLCPSSHVCYHGHIVDGNAAALRAPQSRALATGRSHPSLMSAIHFLFQHLWRQVRSCSARHAGVHLQALNSTWFDDPQSFAYREVN